MEAKETQLDVRSIPRWERHPMIFAAFEDLATGETLSILSDHEPRPLHAQFEQTQAGTYEWAQRQVGDDRWEVRIRKLACISGETDTLAALRRSAILTDLDEATLRDFAYRARKVTYKRHQTVAEQGVIWPYVGVVQSGIVQAVLTTAGGREQAIYDALTGDIFGEVALLDRGQLVFRWVALTPKTSVALVPADLVRSAADRDRSFARRLEEFGAQRTRAILDRFASHLVRSVGARVAKALLAYASPAQGLVDALAPLPMMTQGEIALSAGTVKEVVSRALGEMEHAGALVRQGGRIVKLDRSKLQEILNRD